MKMRSEPWDLCRICYGRGGRSGDGSASAMASPLKLDPRLT